MKAPGAHAGFALPTRRARRALQGVGLVETMVGILIGLLVVLAVYNLLSTAEGYRRTAAGASDAQVSGLLSQFILNRDVGNGGNGVLLHGDDNLNYLASCTLDEAGNPDPSNRPIPALITDGGAGTISDTIVAFNSGSPRVPWPVNFVDADSLPGTDFIVQSPTGFTSPQPKDTRYWVIASVNDGSGRCGRFQVTDAVPGPNVALGEVTLKTSPASTLTYAANVSKLINLGPVGQATRVRYESYNSAAGESCGATDATRACQLYTTDLMNPGAVRNPVAASVVLLKAQYGVDTDAVPDGRVDCWTAADNANTCGDGKDYRPASLETFSVADLNRIIAIRTAVVVRSDEPDLKDPDLVSAKRPDIVLFNCSLDTDAGCPGRIVLPKGNAGQIIADHWSYRSYETVIPLRNSIFVGTLP